MDVGRSVRSKDKLVKSENDDLETVVNYETQKKSVFFQIIKRGIDIFCSLFGLIILSPVFLVVAFLIKKENKKGSVFFSQQRVGKNGGLFTMYKFRSMCPDAEDKLSDLIELNEIEGAMFKMKDDPRVTKIGKLIRRTSIDELPQLLNVLKGEMSLVGPRPPLLREVAEYTEYDMQRLLVKPGCTGLWQISGRNNIGFKEMVELDLYYIKNQSLTQDIVILLKTVTVVLCLNNSNGH
ncbi:sugar transferase [Enterococcus sp. 5H]|uniref:sugar transferase n=1 Tax=Enterococcus sp. 5H TaxID=1229490 RepID=UPI002304BA89|nr:sugar transferase [Enterococcus sp. 5H]MDA9471851.1 Undecaprenyl-phosphate galactosephosphotransferase [Enterococcus sp. 5H]